MMFECVKWFTNEINNEKFRLYVILSCLIAGIAISIVPITGNNWITVNKTEIQCNYGFYEMCEPKCIDSNANVRYNNDSEICEMYVFNCKRISNAYSLTFAVFSYYFLMIGFALSLYLTYYLHKYQIEWKNNAQYYYLAHGFISFILTLFTWLCFYKTGFKDILLLHNVKLSLVEYSQSNEKRLGWAFSLAIISSIWTFFTFISKWLTYKMVKERVELISQIITTLLYFLALASNFVSLLSSNWITAFDSYNKLKLNIGYFEVCDNSNNCVQNKSNQALAGILVGLIMRCKTTLLIYCFKNNCRHFEKKSKIVCWFSIILLHSIDVNMNRISWFSYIIWNDSLLNFNINSKLSWSCYLIIFSNSFPIISTIFMFIELYYIISRNNNDDQMQIEMIEFQPNQTL